MPSDLQDELEGMEPNPGRDPQSGMLRQFPPGGSSVGGGPPHAASCSPDSSIKETLLEPRQGLPGSLSSKQNAPSPLGGCSDSKLRGFSVSLGSAGMGVLGTPSPSKPSSGPCDFGSPLPPGPPLPCVGKMKCAD